MFDSINKMENCSICHDLLVNDNGGEAVLRAIKKFQETEQNLKFDTKTAQATKLKITLGNLKMIFDLSHCLEAYYPYFNEHLLMEMDTLNERMMKIGAQICPECPLIGYISA